MQKKRNPTRDFYNKNAAAWASLKTNSFYHEKEFRMFASFFKKGNAILDIGCANGIHVPLFLGIGKDLKYEGIDVSTSFLKIARSRYPHLSFQEGDLLDRQSLPKKKYDGFWAAAILMHIPFEHWPVMLENIERIMKPGAIGYITLPQQRFEQKTSDMRHFEIFDKKRFKKAIEQRGWRIVKSGAKEATATNDWLWFLVELPK